VRWRTPITLAVLVVIVLGAAYYGWHTVVSPVTSSDEGSPTPTRHTNHQRTHLVCTQKKTYPKGTQIGAGSFKVNVYNASAVSGRAAEVLAALVNNGFQSGVAANPPTSVTATNVTILTRTPNSPRVQLVKQQFKGPVKLVPGPELAVGIDVVLGAEFQGVAPDAPGTYTVAKATTICLTFEEKPSGSRH
jgi:hypothetical protein